MTEAEWLSATDSGAMLDFLKPMEGARKTHLFKCACCRCMWPLLSDPRSRAGVEAVERHADGLATRDELMRAFVAARKAAVKLRGWTRKERATDLLWAAAAAAERAADTTGNTGFWASGIARGTLDPTGSEPVAGMLSLPPSEGPHGTRFNYRLGPIVRDIFGNPFRPATFSPSWRTDTVVAIAAQMYESRCFDAMGILADALQDAGCPDGEILEHCRGPGPHVRGCFVVDLVLGKE